MNGKVSARQLYYSCEQSGFNHSSYIILNDGNFVHDFYAKDEDTAKIYFKGFIEGMKCEREMRNDK